MALVKLASIPGDRTSASQAALYKELASLRHETGSRPVGSSMTLIRGRSAPGPEVGMKLGHAVASGLFPLQ